jgi:4-hydroxybenzoate polyprenyltransferase
MALMREAGLGEFLHGMHGGSYSQMHLLVNGQPLRLPLLTLANNIPMPAVAASVSEKTVPLCVDLDGTLIKTDVLWESLMVLLKRNPLYLLAVPFWFLRGRAFLKKEIAERVELNPAWLPYHQPFLDYLRTERKKGRVVMLATASDEQLAKRIADHVGLFDEVLASDGKINMRGHNKGRALAERYGKKGFDYAGNSSVDLPVWSEARQGIVVNASEHLAERARRCTEVSQVFEGGRSKPHSLIRAMRPHQWVKNFIIFVPLLTSHNLANTGIMVSALFAFAAFCCCASGVYVLNDLLDLDADRQHDSKRRRPFASGELPLPYGLVSAPLMLALGAAIAWYLSAQFLAVLALYFVLTTSYSWRIKQVALLDVFFLAGLYTIRLVAGHVATGIKYSFWLLAFSMFIFLSLALVKRFTELKILRQQNRHDSKGRGYVASDLEMVAMLGIANGFLAVLVMALYVNSPEAQIDHRTGKNLYEHAMVLLLVCPLLLFWISRVWLIAHRGQMHDDPIVFALKDRVSYLIGALTLGVVWLATGHF